MERLAAFLGGQTSGQGFDRDERDRRYAAVRARMRAADLVALIMPHATGDWDNLQADTRYLTQVGGNGMATALVFPLEGDPVVAVREARRAEWWRRQQDWIEDVRSPPSLDWSAFYAQGLKELGLSRGRIGVVGLDDVVREPLGVVSHLVFERLREALPHAEFVSATRLMVDVRKRKSAAEIAMLEHAQACADAITDSLAGAGPGLRLHDLYADMTAAAIRRGAEMPSMLLLGCADRMWQTHLGPEFRTIERKDILLVEAEPKFNGYAAQAIRTVPMRALTDPERRVMTASRACFETLLPMFRPGASYGDLLTTWHKVAAREGCCVGRSMGHATGLGQDRPWTTSDGLVGQDDLEIEEGDCFILKPWISSSDGAIAGRVGDVVVVASCGPRRLSRHPLFDSN